MGLERDGAEGEFGEGFGDADYGFELADGDGDGGASRGGDFGGVDLSPDGDEVGGELFAGFGGEAGGTATVGGMLASVIGISQRGILDHTICSSLCISSFSRPVSRLRFVLPFLFRPFVCPLHGVLCAHLCLFRARRGR